MSSPITLSGFNSIDFNVVLNAIMQQERVPVTQLEDEKRWLEAQKSAFGTLASKLAALESAAQGLTASSAFGGTAVTVSDATRLQTPSSGTASEGTYEIFVDQLARAQVTTTLDPVPPYSTADDIVADGGTLTIGGKPVSVTGPVSLTGLANAINATAELPAVASVVRGENGYRLVLTGKRTGEDNSFTITNALTYGGGTPIAFSATNAQTASDAKVRVNNVVATSASNRFDGAIAGLDFTVLKQDVANPVTVTITASSESLKALVQKLVTAFNDVVMFLDDQAAASQRGERNNVGRDSLVRGLRRQLASVLSRDHGSGTYTSLALAGVEFTRSGRLEFKAAAFDKAIGADADGVRALFRGADGTGGAFGALEGAIEQYTQAGGLVPNAQERIGKQVSAIGKRIDDLESRLEVRRAALQKEFIAADQAIAQLKAASGQLGSLGGQFSLF